jgi:hypothetical protein
MRIPPVGNNWVGLALAGALLVIMPGGFLAFGLLLARRMRQRALLRRKGFPVLRKDS